MALLGRIVVVLFGFFAASLVAAAVVIGSVMFPQLSEIDLGLDESTRSIVVGFGFLFISGFALLPAMIVALITEAFAIRGILFYALGGALIGAGCYLSLVPFDPDTVSFQGIVRRELEVMTGAGIAAGLVYWLIAGRDAGRWRGAPPSPPLPPPVPR